MTRAALKALSAIATRLPDDIDLTVVVNDPTADALITVRGGVLRHVQRFAAELTFDGAAWDTCGRYSPGPVFVTYHWSGTWCGFTVDLLARVEVEDLPAPATAEDMAWWAREHAENPDVTPQRAVEACAAWHRLELAGVA